MASYTFYADTGDGTIRKSNANFTTARSSGSGDSVNGGSASHYCSAGFESGTTYNFYIGFFMFDTSNIPITESVVAATFSFSMAGDNSGTAGNQWALTQGFETTWNSLVVGDFSKRSNNPTGTVTEGAPRQNRPVSTESGYYNFTLNAAGMSWIARSGETNPATASATGKTQLTGGWAKDIDNSAPATNDYNLIYFAEQTGTTNDPKLTVITNPRSNFLYFFN